MAGRAARGFSAGSGFAAGGSGSVGGGGITAVATAGSSRSGLAVAGGIVMAGTGATAIAFDTEIGSDVFGVVRKIGLIGPCCASAGAPVKLIEISIASKAEQPIHLPCDVRPSDGEHRLLQSPWSMRRPCASVARPVPMLRRKQVDKQMLSSTPPFR